MCLSLFECMVECDDNVGSHVTLTVEEVFLLCLPGLLHSLPSFNNAQ